ncbi:MAG TPA: hypothetical protein VLI54_07195 [Bacillota bacterium]|nr:hypothetical protein [Bacillota bacterium]
MSETSSSLDFVPHTLPVPQLDAFEHPRMPFGPDEQAILELIPSLRAGMGALVALQPPDVLANRVRDGRAPDEIPDDPDEVAEETVPVGEEGSITVRVDADSIELTTSGPVDEEADETAALAEQIRNTTISRRMMRDSVRKFKPEVLQFLRAGLALVTQHEDPDDGLAAGRAIVEDASEGLLTPMWKLTVPNAARPLHGVLAISRKIGVEIITAANTSVSARYHLLKALATEMPEAKGKVLPELTPSRALCVLGRLAATGVHAQLAGDLQEGAYDTRLANDMLRFVEGTKSATGNLDRVRQLLAYTVRREQRQGPVDSAVLREGMVDDLEYWPDDARQAVVNARRVLQIGMQSNASAIGRVLEQAGLMGGKDPEIDLERATLALAEAFLARVNVGWDGDPTARPDIMIMRAGIKKRRSNLTRAGKRALGRETAGPSAITAEPERLPLQQEPYKILACDPHDSKQRVVEGYEGLISAYLEEISQKSADIRADLEKMFGRLIQVPNPQLALRGIKPVADVTFSFDGKPHRVMKLKPMTATGLSIRTRQAEDTRIFFIEPRGETKTRIVIGVVQRGQQEKFIADLRKT